MAFWAKFFGLPLTYFLNYIFYIFLISLATYKLTKLIFRNKYAAFLSTITILFSKSITLGGNILVTKDFSAPQLPLGLSLLGIVFLLENNVFWAVICLTISSYLHPLVGIVGTLIIFFSFVISAISTDKEKLLCLLKAVFSYIFFIG